MDATKALERYLRHHRAEGSSPKTVEYHRHSIGQFVAFLAAQGHSGDVDNLRADDLRRYIEALQGRDLA